MVCKVNVGGKTVGPGGAGALRVAGQNAKGPVQLPAALTEVCTDGANVACVPWR